MDFPIEESYFSLDIYYNASTANKFYFHGLGVRKKPQLRETVIFIFLKHSSNGLPTGCKLFLVAILLNIYLHID